MELIPHGTKIDFLGKSRYAFLLSGLIIIGSILLWFNTGAAKYGIDYKGGHEIVVGMNEGVDSNGIRNALESHEIRDAVVQSFEIGSNQFSIRLGGDAGDAKTVKEQVTQALNDSFKDRFEILKTDFVGPIVGKELRRKSIIALALGLIGILIYISLRFEVSYAVGAVAALFHDVIVCIGFYLLAGHSLSMGTLAAALTIVGYSVNDTIVIFDRVREEVRKRRNTSLGEIMNESVNVMLSRTLITSLLTFFSALALFVVGGGPIADLSFFLVVGIITGSYSTIYIASPVALVWENFRSNRRAKRAAR